MKTNTSLFTFVLVIFTSFILFSCGSSGKLKNKYAYTFQYQTDKAVLPTTTTDDDAPQQTTEDAVASIKEIPSHDTKKAEEILPVEVEEQLPVIESEAKAEESRALSGETAASQPHEIAGGAITGNESKKELKKRYKKEFKQLKKELKKQRKGESSSMMNSYLRIGLIIAAIGLLFLILSVIPGAYPLVWVGVILLVVGLVFVILGLV